ncbi:MAG TPA: asparagine synthase (glutamine-hydrolyzing) [Blastocatellia bacterium]|nr:asparagine synthase (glutamine-hydrolyzing) [Blastocatellia bacterium]
MCGITGYFSPSVTPGPDALASVTRMMGAMAHRGPDDEGLFNDRHAVLGHNRLSIIDLSPAGHQPMPNAARTAWVVFNGEIYNFKQLREELLGLGRKFCSRSDTEVIVEGYSEWGIDRLLARLRGIFAFAIYDSAPIDGSSPRLILARDHFGVKPLYYYLTSDRLIFASEVRALLAGGMVPGEQNPDALVRFLQLGSVPAPTTTVKNVFSVPAAHYLAVDAAGHGLRPYWDLTHFLDDSHRPERSVSFEQAAEAIRALLDEAVSLNLISDVPIGVFLSGGMDSSSLAALASNALDHPVTTLSVVFEEPAFSEAKYARAVADRFSTNHREITIRSSDFHDQLPAIFAAMDQPTIDGVNTYFVSKAAKEAGLTVVLSGTGGDEVFLGYQYFKLGNRIDRAARLLRLLPGSARAGLVHAAGQVLKVIKGPGSEKVQYLNWPTSQNMFLLFRGLFSPRQIRNLIGIGERELEAMGPICSALDQAVDRPFVDGSSILSFRHYLENQLLKDTDVLSMAHSIETRVPFLDHKLVELVLGFAPALKLGGHRNKPLLLEAMAGALPAEVYDRPKMGFTFPFGEWMRGRAGQLREASLAGDFLNPKAVNGIWDRFERGALHWSRPWALTVLGHLNQMAGLGTRSAQSANPSSAAQWTEGPPQSRTASRTLGRSIP